MTAITTAHNMLRRSRWRQSGYPQSVRAIYRSRSASPGGV
jgi:hypothetical protein